MEVAGSTRVNTTVSAAEDPALSKCPILGSLQSRTCNHHIGGVIGVIALSYIRKPSDYHVRSRSDVTCDSPRDVHILLRPGHRTIFNKAPGEVQDDMQFTFSEAVDTGYS